MKKFVAIVLTLVMLLAAVPTFAAEINWADLQEAGAEMIAKGEFVTFDEIAVKIWIPTAFIAAEMTEEYTECGYIGYFMTEDESAAIGVQYVDVDGTAMEDYKAIVAENGGTEVEDCVVNGLPAITYIFEETDSAVIAFTTEMGYILEVSGSPKSDEGFASVLKFVMASIQAAE